MSDAGIVSHASANAGGLACGELRLQLESGMLFRGNNVIDVEAKPRALLLALARAPRLQLSKDALLEMLWTGSGGSEAALTQVVFRLREQLQDHDRSVVKSIRGFGYGLSDSWRRVPVSEPADRFDTLQEDFSVAGSQIPTTVRQRRFGWWLFAVLIIAFSVSLLLVVRHQSSTQAASELQPLVDVVNSSRVEAIWSVMPELEEQLRVAPDSVPTLAAYSKAWSLDYETGVSTISSVLEKALPAAQRAVALDAGSAPAQEALGLALLQLDRMNEARAAYGLARQLDSSNARRWSGMGTILSLTMEPAGALESHLRAQEIEVNEWSELGIAFNQAYMGVDSRDDFERLLTRYPGNVYVPFGYAWTEYWSGRTERAREIMEVEYQRDSGRAWTICILAELRRLDGDEIAAAALMRQHAALYSYFDGDNSLLAWRLLKRYVPEQAQTLEQVLLARTESLAYLLWTKGEISLARGDEAAALHWFQQAWELDLSNGVFLRNWRVDLGVSEYWTHQNLLRDTGHKDLARVREHNLRRAELAHRNGIRALPLSQWRGQMVGLVEQP